MRIHYKNTVDDKAYICDRCGKKISSRDKINLKYQLGCYESTRTIADLCYECFDKKVLFNQNVKERFEIFNRYEVNND